MTNPQNLATQLKLESLQNLLPHLISGVLERLDFNDLHTFAKLNALECYMHSNKPDSIKALSEHIGSTNHIKRVKQAKNFIAQATQVSPPSRNLLISQLPEDKPFLTVTEGKIYGIYVVNSNGLVIPIDSDFLTDEVVWGDHCINPSHFHNLTKKLGCEYENETFAFICHQWVENYLNSDWTKLHKFLPKEEQ